MNKISLEKFYQRYRGYLDVTAGHLGDRKIPFILQACRLRPLSSMHERLSATPKLERLWADEFGNILRIGKNKRIKITYNELQINRDRIKCTDLFANVSLADLYAISKLLYVCKGSDEITHSNVYILTFLGKDNYFRTRVYADGAWDKTVSTLHLGIYVLKMISENINIRYFLELSSKGQVPVYPLVNVRHWITYLPAHTKFGSVVKSESELMYKTIGLDLLETVKNG